VAALGVLVVPACDALAPIATPTGPANRCPANPCSDYRQTPAPTCSADGVCAAQDDGAGAFPENLLLVVGLTVDGFLAPGRTYVMTLGRSAPQTGPCKLQNCALTSCSLQAWIEDTGGEYLVNPVAQQQVHWDLGNPTSSTAVPSQALYRPRLQSGSTTVDAIDLGLPLTPVSSMNVPSSYLGPNGAEGLSFEAYLQQLCYERTIQPYSPYAVAFPPDVKPWTMQTVPSPISFDATSGEIGVPPMTSIPTPTFDFRRAEGLDGWTAYLRSIANGRVYSNVASLSGSDMVAVLATSHVTTATGDALDDLELVIAPPVGTPLPTEVIVPLGTGASRNLAYLQLYPSLPLPVTVGGSVTGPQGTPVSATIVFTATDILDKTGMPFPPNFEFVTQVSTTADSGSGGSTYAAILPQGHYSVAVQPKDGSSAITLSTLLVSAPTGQQENADLTVGRLVAVSGKAQVADGRPLSDAIVEAVPTACAASSPAAQSDASTTQSLTLPADSSACMPRPVQTISGSDGSFDLALDPGSYLLRVEPVQGSHLPWVRQSLTIGLTDGAKILDTIVVPAPLRVQMLLTAGDDNVVANSLVRIFTDPTVPSSGGAAIELGRALTDSQGNYEIDLAPTE
jgi:hypothetical protein